MSNVFLPIGLRMTGRRCTIVGAGAVAARKAEKLAQAGAELHVIAPDFLPSRDHWETLGARLTEGRYSGLAEQERPFLVVAATSQPSVNAQVARDARGLGALVVRVDDPADSDLIFPATLRRGRFTVSFATDGVAPTLARQLRQNAEADYDESFATLTELFARLHQEVLWRTLPQETQHGFLSLERMRTLRNVIQQRGEQAAYEALMIELGTAIGSVPIAGRANGFSSAPPRDSRLPSGASGQEDENSFAAQDRNMEPLTMKGTVRLPDARGLLIVHTGDGKGKTSAALNLVYRHLAHGRSAAVIQFIKKSSDFEYGDLVMLERLRAQGCPVTVSMLGAGYTWRTGDSAECHDLAERGWERAAAAILDPKIELVVCDELHIALFHRHLDLEPVMRTIADRPRSSHVVTTGRHAPEQLIDAADLVTDFVAVKHPLGLGVRAQAGIEY